MTIHRVKKPEAVLQFPRGSTGSPTLNSLWNFQIKTIVYSGADLIMRRRYSLTWRDPKSVSSVNPPIPKKKSRISLSSSLRSALNEGAPVISGPYAQTREQMIDTFNSLVAEYQELLRTHDKLTEKTRNVEYEIAKVYSHGGRVEELIEKVKHGKGGET
jgi:hypothetical protein